MGNVMAAQNCPKLLNGLERVSKEHPSAPTPRKLPGSATGPGPSPQVADLRCDWYKRPGWLLTNQHTTGGLINQRANL